MNRPHPSSPSLRAGGRGTAALTVLVASALLLGGCAGDYVSRTRGVRAAYEHYDHEQALKQLEREEKEKSSIDELLVLLDKGAILHSAGRWQESIAVLSRAEKLATELDYLSVSEEAKTLLSNERERAYRGEDFEKLMINVLLALNYAQLGKDEDALVEVRRVNERLLKMVREEKKPYEQLAIARYLGGVLYEDQGQLDSAFIDYQKAIELQPDLGELAEPALRLAKQLGRDSEYERLRKKYPSVEHGPLAEGEGQVVAIIETGLSPQKHSTTNNSGGQLLAIPVYHSRAWRLVQARLTAGERTAIARRVTSLDQVAQQHLNDRIGKLVAKSLATTAVKAAVAGGIGYATKSQEAGLLAFWLLTLSNQPDLRSWLSLPGEFQVARLRLPAGTHTVELNAQGRTTKHEVEVKPGRVALIVARRY
ncbi:MAG: COG3014 family protein [Myxococcales bacterium]